MRHALGAVVALSMIAGHAHAQSGASTLAEQLFNQGRDLAKANQWADACPKFEASLRYDPALGTRLNLATCYEHIGKIASAWGLYRESIDIAKKAGDTKRADYAQKQASALEPRLPKLAITAPPGAPAGLIVKRDDTPVEAGALGAALYVDPGTHTITVSAPGFEAVTLTVSLAEGKTETLAIPALVAKPAPAVNPVKPSQQLDQTESAASSARTRRYIGLGIGAGGVVAVGVGLVFGAKANSSLHDAKSLCGDKLACTSATFDKGKSLVHDAQSSATISTVLVGVGGAAIVAGAIVYFTAPRAPERATARILPVVHDGGAGLALTGAF